MAHIVCEKLKKRLAECKLVLHPDKTKVVYCKDEDRRKSYSNISYTFLGYTFQPRGARNRATGKIFTSFLPAAGREAQKSLRSKLKAMRLRSFGSFEIEELAVKLNPVVGGWFNYFKHFCPSTLVGLKYYIDRRLTAWARNKFRWGVRKAQLWLERLKIQQPKLFAHW